MSNIDAVTTVQDLTHYIHQTLCEVENLLEEQFSTRVMELKKAGRFCGLQFTLNGPRNVRLGAVWASDQNIVYFYNARGERYHKLQLRKRIFREAAA